MHIERICVYNNEIINPTVYYYIPSEITFCYFFFLFRNRRGPAVIVEVGLGHARKSYGINNV